MAGGRFKIYCVQPWKSTVLLCLTVAFFQIHIRFIWELLFYIYAFLYFASLSISRYNLPKCTAHISSLSNAFDLMQKPCTVCRCFLLLTDYSWAAHYYKATAGDYSVLWSFFWVQSDKQLTIACWLLMWAFQLSHKSMCSFQPNLWNLLS